MTPETAYRWIVRLYPRAFQRAYAEQMQQTFASLASDHRRSPLRLWWRIVRDVPSSLGREYIDAWTGGEGPLALRWLTACALGTLASGVAIAALLFVVGHFFPPYRRADGSFHIVATNLPVWIYGGVMAAALGSVQAALIAPAGRRIAWAAATAVAGAVGIPFGFVVARSYFAGVFALGAAVGAAQSLILRRGIRASIEWTVFNGLAIAAAVGVLIGADALYPARPWTWGGAVLIFGAYPALSGIAVGLVTVRRFVVRP